MQKRKKCEKKRQYVKNGIYLVTISKWRRQGIKIRIEIDRENEKNNKNVLMHDMNGGGRRENEHT